MLTDAYLEVATRRLAARGCSPDMSRVYSERDPLDPMLMVVAAPCLLCKSWPAVRVGQDAAGRACSSDLPTPCAGPTPGERPADEVPIEEGAEPAGEVPPADPAP